MRGKNGKPAAAGGTELKPTERVEELLALMDEQNLLELEISDGESEVKLSKQSFIPMARQPAAAGGAPAGLAGGPAPAEPKPAEKGTPVKSPLAGVFYRAPSPEAPSFVKEGDVVTPERVLCIVEAMKVLNEINAGVHGKITRIMLENGKPVSSGQIIFYVEPV